MTMPTCELCEKREAEIGHSGEDLKVLKGGKGWRGQGIDPSSIPRTVTYP